MIEGNKIGNVVNVVINGSLISKTCKTIIEANNLYRFLLKTKENPNDLNVEHLKKLLQKKSLKEINDVIFLDEDTKEYFYKDYDVPMPKGLADAIIDYYDQKFPANSLENFWSLLITNPNKLVQQKLFNFLSTYNFAITEHGYVVGYKAVTHFNKVNNDLATFISNQYVKIKTRKKSPKNYSILKDSKGELFLVETASITLDADNAKEHVGILDDMYKNIASLDSANSTQFTDKKTRSMNIKLGVPVKEDRLICDPNPDNECSNGLHVGSVKYIQNNSFVKKEDTILLVLFNPQHVVAVPNHDNSKMRVCEYFPMAVLERKENNQFETIDTPFVEYDYLNYEIADLKKAVEELTNKKKQSPELITISDEDRLKILKNRLIDLTK